MPQKWLKAVVSSTRLYCETVNLFSRGGPHLGTATNCHKCPYTVQYPPPINRLRTRLIFTQPIPQTLTPIHTTTYCFLNVIVYRIRKILGVSTLPIQRSVERTSSSSSHHPSPFLYRF